MKCTGQTGDGIYGRDWTLFLMHNSRMELGRLGLGCIVLYENVVRTREEGGCSKIIILHSLLYITREGEGGYEN